MQIISFNFFSLGQTCLLYTAVSLNVVTTIRRALLNSIRILLVLLFVLRRREAQVAAGRRGLAAARGPPAAATLASPPGVHTQPHGGRPDLGADRTRPAPLGAPPHPGARRHPAQHEAAGESGCSVGREGSVN